MKKLGIIKRLVIGKTREKDLTEDDLPATRPKQFKFVLRTRLGVILRLSILASLFFVPFAVWDILSSGYVASTVADMKAAEYLSRLIQLVLLRYGTEIPLIMIACIGLAGLLYCVRRICWGQSIRIFADFGKGIKQSWGQFVLLGLLSGIVNVLTNYIFRFCLLTMDSGNSLGLSVAMALAVLFGIVWIIAMMFALCQCSLYELRFGRLMINSFILTFKRLFRSFLFCMLSLAPILVFTLMPWAFIKIIGYAFAALFALGFAATLQTVYCHGVFDEFINKKSYPEFVRIGMCRYFDGETDGMSSDVSETAADDEKAEQTDRDGSDMGSAECKSTDESGISEADGIVTVNADADGGSGTDSAETAEGGEE